MASTGSVSELLSRVLTLEGKESAPETLNLLLQLKDTGEKAGVFGAESIADVGSNMGLRCVRLILQVLANYVTNNKELVRNIQIQLDQAQEAG